MRADTDLEDLPLFAHDLYHLHAIKTRVSYAAKIRPTPLAAEDRTTNTLLLIT